MLGHPWIGLLIIFGFGLGFGIPLILLIAWDMTKDLPKKKRKNKGAS